MTSPLFDLDTLVRLDVLIPLGLVVVISVIVAWILLTKNKKIYKEITKTKQRFSEYEKQVQSLKQSSTQPKDFERLNNVSRAFFKEYLNLSYSLTYLELESNFKKQNKQDYAQFCKLMSDANYQGDQKSPEQIKQLIDLFAKIIENYK